MKNLTKKFLGMFLSILLIFPATAMAIPFPDKIPDEGKIVGITEDGKDWIVQVDKIHPKGQKDNNAKSPSCYKLLGPKWSVTPVNYVINPSNPYGLDENTFVIPSIVSSAETWDAATSTELFNNAYSVNYNAVWGNRDFSNNIVFGDYPSDNAIAVTRYWYTLIGRQMLEFDVIFNTRFTFGDGATNPSVFDLQGIATHEIGHGAGLNDIYSTTCGYVTMYGYSWPGDDEKRTIELPDIAGIQKMYGS